MFPQPVFNTQLSTLRSEVLQKMRQFTPESHSCTHEAFGYSKKKKVQFPLPLISSLSYKPFHALSIKTDYGLMSFYTQSHGHAHQENGGFKCDSSVIRILDTRRLRRN